MKTIKIIITIYKGDELIATSSIITSKKKEDNFINAHIPKMKMSNKIKEGWRIFRSF